MIESWKVCDRLANKLERSATKMALAATVEMFGERGRAGSKMWARAKVSAGSCVLASPANKATARARLN